MNSLILISPSLVRGFQPILSGKCKVIYKKIRHICTIWLLRLWVISYSLSLLNFKILCHCLPRGTRLYHAIEANLETA